VQLLGVDLSRARDEPITLGLSGPIVKSLTGPLVTQWPTALNHWFGTIRESFAGAWQRSITVDRQEVLTYGTVWACVTLIAADIAKLWLNLVEEDADGICTPTQNPAYSPVLRKPNRFSTRVKFLEYWMISKFTAGNTYVLKARDNRGVVTALYVLDPTRVDVLVAPDGSVFYALGTDYLSGLEAASVVVPAREIIHDLCVPLYHPLVGVSPIHACGLAATQGLKIQQTSARLAANGSQPGGILTAPSTISNETAKRLEDHWATHYAGEQNMGKVVALGDGLTYTPLMMSAVDAQVIETLKWTAETICACFHVPGYMVGIGPAPPYTDIQSINLQYYTQALQNPIENLEVLLEEGLELKGAYSIEVDLDALARMDTKTQAATAVALVGGGIDTPNEGRARFNRKPKPGGDTPYLQAQMYSLAALNARDLAAAAPSSMTPTPTPTPPPGGPEPTKAIEFDEGAAIVIFKARAVVKGVAVPPLPAERPVEKKAA